MNESINSLRKELRRKAVIFDIGGFRPPEDPQHSWFGKVLFCAPNELWPMQDGKPMHALAQINMTQLPFKPKGLEDIDFITLFIGPQNLPDNEPNGSHWVLRAYKHIGELIPLTQQDSNSYIKAFPMMPKVIEEDYPCRDDLKINLEEYLDDPDEYEDLFENVAGFKLGGWPTLIQSEIFWAPYNKHPACPEYVFQVDSTSKGNWEWGDNGIGYFSRGTVAGKEDEWHIAWQCY